MYTKHDIRVKSLFTPTIKVNELHEYLTSQYDYEGDIAFRVFDEYFTIIVIPDDDVPGSFDIYYEKEGDTEYIKLCRKHELYTVISTIFNTLHLENVMRRLYPEHYE